MTPERWKKLEALFHEARALEGEARAAHLAKVCGDDEQLRAEVERLLAAHERESSFLDSPIFEQATALSTDERNQSLVGRCLGPYQVRSLIGRGGMGEVYRALDTRLGREVAIKLLPSAFATDQDRLRRFEQEARAASALNHPNILTIYDIGTASPELGGAPYIVSELLAGEELRAQLNDGARSVRKALDYAQQIARGLAAAHERGIVHRDLKPENLFVTADERVKILDFGLAKLKPPKLGGDVDSQAPTEQAHTDPGAIMGTVGYMSPEQVRGQEADHRSDIFSFGIILFEMLTGQRMFQHETLAETMTAILREEPPELSETNKQISPQLEKTVRRCLEKKPERRFQSASDLGFALEALSTPSGARLETAALPAAGKARLFGKAHLAWIVAAVAVLTALSLAVAYFRRAPAESHDTYTYLPLPEKTTSAFAGGSAISPDGRRVVLVAVAEGVNRLWLYSFDAPMPMMLAGTEGARFPFWSPSGRSIGFFAQGKLKRIEAAGGRPTTLCDAPPGYGGAWSSTGVILFAPEVTGHGLYRVSESGGTATPATSLNASRLELGHRFPTFLPDGRHFVFLALSGQPEYRGIQLGSLDQPQIGFLQRADANAEYSSAGYLLFVRGRKLLAQKFDPEKLVLSGDPVPVTEQVDYDLTTRHADLSVFSDRVLLYRSGGNLNGQLVWFGRSGRQLAAVGPAGEYRSLQLSPDGGQVILERTDPQVENSDLWQLDLRRETLTRLTFNPANDFSPIWSPDGNWVVFTSSREGFFGIYQKGVSGDDQEELLLRGDPRLLVTSDWSGDGKFIVHSKDHEKTGSDLAVLPLSGDRQPHNYLATQFQEFWAKVSPDGRWLAYQSTESGRYEIYVQPFPVPGRKVTVSKGGGSFPHWRSDGKELYYVGADDKLIAVPVETGASFSAGIPVTLFEVGSFGRRISRYVYDVSRDGERFLMIRPQEDASTRPLTVVLNWTAELKR